MTLSCPVCLQYSFGLRQQLYTLLNGRPDQCKCADPGHLKQTDHHCPPGGDPDGCLLVGGHSRDYIGDLQRSVFCVVLPGNGWGHIEEPVIHGCSARAVSQLEPSRSRLPTACCEGSVRCV